MRATHQLDAAPSRVILLPWHKRFKRPRLSRGFSSGPVRQRQERLLGRRCRHPAGTWRFSPHHRRRQSRGSRSRLDHQGAGGFEKHPRFGDSSTSSITKRIRPPESCAIERYLASEIKGIGPGLARRIVGALWRRPRRMLDNAPERMRGSRARHHGCATDRHRMARRVGLARAHRLFARTRAWPDARAPDPQILRQGRARRGKRDPYVLARTIYGIGFRTADAIAEKLGIPRNSIQRARAAVALHPRTDGRRGPRLLALRIPRAQFQTASRWNPTAHAQ